MPTLGASFSLHRCSELDVDKKAVLGSALEELGFRRFRLMSYWNIHEQKQGKYDFSELDWQLDMIAEYGGEVTLCIGKRQPRWPECHMPKWAQELPHEEWRQRLYDFIEVVVKRYKSHPSLTSWQLENEALLKEFGYCPDGDYDPKRLQIEIDIVKKIDKKHPVIMTLSDSWGLPIKKPKPDAFAMSLYRSTINKHGEFVISKRPASFYAIRSQLIKTLRRRPVFIHELQAEPWLSKSILETTLSEQLERMTPEQITKNVLFATDTGMDPIDLWGLEWWYWLKEHHNRPEQWNAVKKAVSAHE